jgi:site-specific recombinase XerD
MKLLEQLEVVARRRGLARNTIEVYRLWLRQFLAFCAHRHGIWKHPTELGTADVEEFLNDLVMRRRLSGSSQNQALNALVFLYKHVLEDAMPQDHLGKFLLQRSRRPKRMPTVLSGVEVRRLIEAIDPSRMSEEDLGAVAGDVGRLARVGSRSRKRRNSWRGTRRDGRLDHLEKDPHPTLSRSTGRGKRV